MAKIYTKTGDDGTTGLVNGKRVVKFDHRIDLYGDVDELNSFIGLVVSYLTQLDNSTEDNSSDIEGQILLLKQVQHNLFNLGSQLACELNDRAKYNLPDIDPALVSSVEKNIDKMTEDLGPLRNFILPGGSVISATVHVARTTARRVERKLVEFNQTTEKAPTSSVILLNRISDYLFVLARYVNKCLGYSEDQWSPKAKAPTSGA